MLNNRWKSRAIMGLFGLMIVFYVCAEPSANHSPEAIRQQIAKALGIALDQVRPAPVPGWYEIQHDHEFGYVSADGTYLMEGDLVDIRTGKSLTEQRRRTDRLRTLEQLGNGNMISFAPPSAARYVVTVFTDVDCPYCRKLHSQIPEYNAKGIAIRYVFFPRQGLGSQSYRQAVAVWCSADRKTALGQAKQGEVLPAGKCENPVAREYQLALDLGIRGTPGMILPDGRMFDGYAPPEQLLSMVSSRDNAPEPAKN